MSETTHFVGREEELQEIHTTLSHANGRQIVVIHGLGGMGKTQLAVAYAKRHEKAYSAIFWLNIRDEDSLKQSFSSLAQRISRVHPSTGQLGITHESTLDETSAAVKAWLALPQNSQWLVIFDNYDTPKVAGYNGPGAIDIRQFLPDANHGSILVTTRMRVDMGHQIRLEKLTDVKECMRVLSERSRWEQAVNGTSVRSASIVPTDTI